MRYTSEGAYPFSLVKVELNQGEQVRLETGAMVYHSEHIKLEGKVNGKGILSALGRSIGGGEGFFKTIATSGAYDQYIGLAPKTIGEIKELEVGAKHYILNDGVFLASDMGVDYEVIRQKKLGNALFGGQGGFFVMRSNGVGSLLVASFGSMVEIELDGTTPITIDNYHVVCWEDTLDYDIHFASGTFGFKTGEGLANTFRGRGKIYLQTRNIQGFASCLLPFMPTNGSNGGGIVFS